MSDGPRGFAPPTRWHTACLVPTRPVQAGYGPPGSVWLTKLPGRRERHDRVRGGSFFVQQMARTHARLHALQRGHSRAGPQCAS